MKTKYYLSSMVLTALLAACTNDDFETQNQSIADSVLSGRAKGELVLTASRADLGKDAADTRIVADPSEDGRSYGWLWEDKNDKIGAVLVDYKGGEGLEQIAGVDDNYMITNYPFAPNISAPATAADFSTPTAVQEGAYMFYNRYDGQNTQRRKLVAEIDRIQQVNAGQEAGLIQIGTRENGGQNFFISPIVDVAIPDESPIQIPVILKSAAAVLNFNFKADLDNRYYGNFKVNKVTLQHVSTETPFYRTLTVNPKAIAKIQHDIKEMQVNGTTPYSDWFLDNGAIKTRNLDRSLVDEQQIRDAFDLVANRISGEAAGMTALPEIGTKSGETKELTYQLETPYVFENGDQTMNLMVVIPADTYKYAEGEKVYQNVKGGLFLLNVYTSEGIYHAYVGTKDRMFKRGVVVNMPEQTMIMKGGNMNVEPYKHVDAFTVETTEDWNYTIEYIREHFNDFTQGENNVWKTPTINLQNQGGEGTIVVDADHYFLEYPVIYSGNVTLKLEGQDEYKIDPKNVIFGTGDNRPTLNVTNQKNATVLFDQDINDKLQSKDGEDVTMAIKLVSDANVLIKGGVEVDFEMLDNRGNMTIERNLGGDFNRDETVARILGNSKNSGNITVGGKLDATADGVSFTNEKNATITAQSFESGSMDDEDRGQALFQNLNNKGTLVTEVSSPNKGTWGGLISVEGKLTNEGPINNNGELMVEEIENIGAVITLGEDPYAYVSIKKGSLTDAVKGGKLVLADATTYEFYRDALRTTQNLGSEDLKGVIETTVDSQEEYTLLMNNYNRYSVTNQETALKVLNTVYVKSSLTLSSEAGNKELEHMTLYLENATLNVTAATENVKFGALYANKGNNAVNVNSGKAKTIETGRVDVVAGAGLTVGAGVTMLVDWKGAGVNSINVAGTLTNNGEINTEESDVEINLAKIDAKGRINTFVAKGGQLVNNGTLSQPYSFLFDNAVYGRVSTLIEKLAKSTDDRSPYRGVYVKYEPRVDVINYTVDALKNGNTGTWSPEEEWGKKAANKNDQITVGKLYDLLTKGQLVYVAGYQALAMEHPITGWSYVLYLGGAIQGADDEEHPVVVLTESEKEAWVKIVGRCLDTTEDEFEANPIFAKTYFYVDVNNGTLTLNPAPAEAYGSVGTNNGNIIGDFVK